MTRAQLALWCAFSLFSLTGCSFTEFEAGKYDNVVANMRTPPARQGMLTKYGVMDVWKDGLPNRPFEVIGLVSHMDSFFSVLASPAGVRRKLASKAVHFMADGIILLPIRQGAEGPMSSALAIRYVLAK